MRRMVAALAMTLLLLSLEARAGDRLVVGIVSNDATTEMENHLTAQLHQLGFDVTDVARLGDPASPEAAPSTVAVFKVRDDDTIELWIVEEGQPRQREVFQPTSGSQDYRYATAVRAVESLRARLVKLGVLPPPASDEPETPPPPPPGIQSEPDPESGLSVGVGGAVLRSAGGVPATGHAVVSATWAVDRGIGLRGFGFVPVMTAELEGPEGRAEVEPTLLGASFLLESGDGAARPTAGAGLAFVHVDTKGEAAASFRGHQDGTSAAVGFATVGMAVHPSSALRIGGDVMVGTALPRADVVFDERKAATWGTVVVGVTIGVEARLF